MPILRKLLLMLTLAGVLAANGLHLVALQLETWAETFAQYNEIMPTARALQMTLDNGPLCGATDWVAELDRGNDGTEKATTAPASVNSTLLVLLLTPPPAIHAPSKEGGAPAYEKLTAPRAGPLSLFQPPRLA